MLHLYKIFKSSLFFCLLIVLGTSTMAQPYVNGNLSTGATAENGTAAPTGTTWSELQHDAGVTTVANGTSGVSASITNGVTVADNFTVPAGQTWTISKFTFYGYQTGFAGSASPFTTLRLQIHNGNPSLGATTIVYGDLTANRFSASANTNIYRIFNTIIPATPTGTTRIIWTVEANISTTLNPGTYWVEYQTDVTGGGGHFLPLATAIGARTQAGWNAIQKTVATGAWAPINDLGTTGAAPVAMDMPFKIDYTAGVSTACSGIPAPGNTISSLNPVCSGVNFTLSVQNATTGTGVTYQWQSSTDGITFTNITGATSATLTTSQTVATYYRLNVTCGGNTTASNPLQVAMNAVSNCYCTAGATSASFEKIARVKYNTIDNPSTSTAGYENFTGLSTNITQGVTTPITVTLSQGFTSDQVIVFIDYNQNGLFTDPGETVYTSPLGAGPHTGNITIPFTATTGPTRMRVRMHDTGSTPANATSCGTSIFGQVEDYTINVVAAPACTGAPAPGNTIATPASVCAGVSFTLRLQNKTNGLGVTYQWQSSPDGVTFTNIAGATDSIFTTSQNGATYFRANVTCSGSTTASNPVQVAMSSFLTCYCTAGATSLAFEKISRVQFNTINNPSTSTAGYENFTAISTTIGAATSSPVSVTISTPFTTDQVIVFIDFNHNGSFTDPGETVFTSTLPLNTAAPTVTGSITIPGNALTGITRMRVRLHDSGAGPNPGPCGNSTYGQVEDYTLDIQCTPLIINTQPTATTAICNGSGGSISIDAIGSFITYQWQVSTDNGLTYTNITDGAVYTGTNTNRLIINGATAAFNGNKYRVLLNGLCTTANTASAVSTLFISSPPSITLQPVSVSACATANTSFTVLTAGPSIFVQWQVSTDGGNTFTNIPGANGQTLLLTGVTFAMNGYKYRAIVNGQAPCPAAISNVVILTVFALPKITIEADPNTKLIPGLTTTLVATVTPPSPTSIITWFRNGLPVPGATGNRYVVDIDGLGTYTAKVTDVNGCSVTSNSILISDSASGKVFIYPSPNNGQFHIRYYSAPGNTLARSIIIYNSLGEKVMSRVADVTGAYGRVDVDLRNSGKGIFWVELWVGNTRLAHGKVLVQ